MASKYSALGKFFANLTGDRVVLKFADIEKIIDATLPPSASDHAGTWWSNAKTGNRSWSQLWQSAGWVKESVNSESREVTFRRINAQEVSPEDLLTNLVPTTKETIYDILDIAGISTLAWQTTGDGRDVSNVKANPNFCYDWSFGSETEGYALCIEYEMLRADEGKIIYHENLQTLARELDAVSRNSSFDQERRSRAAQQAGRARAFDAALSSSYFRGLPVQVILTKGDRRDRDDLGQGYSQVKYRTLDPVKWYVHRYDPYTGATLMIRAVKPEGVVGDAPVDQHDSGDDMGTPDEIQLRAIRTRRGQAQFREKLLSAYCRRCAVTGCRVVELLEAAHIRPHAEEPNYRVPNGLILRADIHTLFDIGLLSIDTRYRVHIAPEIMNSEYRQFDGMELKQIPELPSEMPSAEYLEKRHLKFKKKYRPG